MKGKKTIKTEVLEQIEDNKACFNVWMKEADNRERKQLQKQTTLLNMSDTNKTEKKKKDMNTVTDTISPLYPSLKGVDPGLDVPLPHPNPTAARKRPTGEKQAGTRKPPPNSPPP